MNARIVIDRLTRTIVVILVAVGCATAAAAQPIPSTDSVTVIVFDDRYIVGDRGFDDLDYLEQSITATQIHSVTLLVCGPRATRSLKAVVHRFRHVPVQMRVPDIDEAACMSTAPLLTPVRQRIGQPPFGIDDEAVERYWHDIMP